MCYEKWLTTFILIEYHINYHICCFIITNFSVVCPVANRMKEEIMQRCDAVSLAVEKEDSKSNTNTLIIDDDDQFTSAKNSFKHVRMHKKKTKSQG